MEVRLGGRSPWVPLVEVLLGERAPKSIQEEHPLEKVDEGQKLMTGGKVRVNVSSWCFSGSVPPGNWVTLRFGPAPCLGEEGRWKYWA